MSQTIIEKAMKLALKLARASMEAGNGPFGAVVVLEDHVIGQSRNTTKEDLDPTAHAEIKAIRNACLHLRTVNLKGATLVTSCYPCPMCQSALYWAGIDNVYYALTNQDTTPYGYDDSVIYKELTLTNEEKKVDFHQTMQKNGVKLFQIKQESSSER